MDPHTLPFPILVGPKAKPYLGNFLKVLAIVPIVFFVVPWFLFVIALGTQNENLMLWDTQTHIVVGIIGILLFMFILPAPLLALYNTGQRLGLKNALEVLRDDPRPPVFFLRSFDDDPILDTSLMQTFPRRLEDTLAKSLDQLGPVIAIGRPGESIPELGAARFYVSDEDWQKAAIYFMDRAAVVVILVGKTKGVQWEIRTALERVPPERLLLGFPYIHPDRRLYRQFLRLINNEDRRYSKKMLGKIIAERDQRYTLFREEFGVALKSKLPADLGANIFIEFDHMGNPLLLRARRHIFKANRDPQQADSQPDYSRTLRPFLEKKLNKNIQPSIMEWLMATRAGLALLITLIPAVYLILLWIAWESGEDLIIPLVCIGVPVVGQILWRLVLMLRLEMRL